MAMANKNVQVAFFIAIFMMIYSLQDRCWLVWTPRPVFTPAPGPPIMVPGWTQDTPTTIPGKLGPDGATYDNNDWFLFSGQTWSAGAGVARSLSAGRRSRSQTGPSWPLALASSELAMAGQPQVITAAPTSSGSGAILSEVAWVVSTPYHLTMWQTPASMTPATATPASTGSVTASGPPSGIPRWWAWVSGPGLSVTMQTVITSSTPRAPDLDTTGPSGGRRRWDLTLGGAARGTAAQRAAEPRGRGRDTAGWQSRTWGPGPRVTAGGQGQGGWWCTPASPTAPRTSGTDRSPWTARPGQCEGIEEVHLFHLNEYSEMIFRKYFWNVMDIFMFNLQRCFHKTENLLNTFLPSVKFTRFDETVLVPWTCENVCYSCWLNLNRPRTIILSEKTFGLIKQKLWIDEREHKS